MSDPTITDPPTAPSRSSRSAFVATTNTFLDYLVTLAGEVAAVVPWIRARTDEVAAAAEATAGDRIATAADVEATGEDRVATGEDRVATGEDRVATGEDVAAAGASLATMDTYYLREQASDPATDLNGDPVQDGAWYSNTTLGVPRLRRGGRWVTAVFDANGALMATNNFSDVDDAPTAKQNLGLKPVASAEFANQTEAEQGSNNTKPMTPLRTAQAIAALAAGGGITKEIFTTSGTFIKEDDDIAYYVECIGGGGGGVNETGTISAPGGAGGVYVDQIFLASEISDSVPITVGAGGAGCPNGSSDSGSPGGHSSFGEYFNGYGGNAGNDFNAESFALTGGVLAVFGASTDTAVASIPSPFGGYGGSGNGDASGYWRGGNAVYGGGGGGAARAANTPGVGGASRFAGDGGDGNNTSDVKASDGQAPGGGGGGSTRDGGGGDGARGEVRVWRIKQ